MKEVILAIKCRFVVCILVVGIILGICVYYVSENLAYTVLAQISSK